MLGAGATRGSLSCCGSCGSPIVTGRPVANRSGTCEEDIGRAFRSIRSEAHADLWLWRGREAPGAPDDASRGDTRKTRVRTTRSQFLAKHPNLPEPLASVGFGVCRSAGVEQMPTAQSSHPQPSRSFVERIRPILDVCALVMIVAVCGAMLAVI